MRTGHSPLDAPDWLTAALRPILSRPDARVTCLRRERIGAERAGAVLNRVHLAYAPQAAGPASVVAKVSPSHTARYEAWFYDRVAPSLPAPSPLCHATAADPTTGSPVLLLEDITAGRWPSDGTGTPDDVADVLDAIAPLHAAGRASSDTEGAWVCPPDNDAAGRMCRQDNDDPSRWASPADAAELAGWLGDRAAWDAHQTRYQQHWRGFADLFGLALPGRIRALAERLCAHLTDVLAKLDTAPKTIVHGNLHLDNAVFQVREPQRPVVLLDWHRVGRAAAAVDLARIVPSSLDVGDRRAHEHDLLRHYQRRMRELGVPEGELAGLHDEYVLALMVNFAAAVGRLASSLAVGRRSCVGDGRLITALLDHDADHVLASLCGQRPMAR